MYAKVMSEDEVGLVLRHSLTHFVGTPLLVTGFLRSLMG